MRVSETERAPGSMAMLIYPLLPTKMVKRLRKLLLRLGKMKTVKELCAFNERKGLEVQFLTTAKNVDFKNSI